MICRGVRLRVNDYAEELEPTIQPNPIMWRRRRPRTEARNPRRSAPLGLMEADRIQKQIIGMLKEQEAGAKTADVCRKHGISAATFYKFKAKFGGMEVSDARRLKALEDENARLKKLLAEQMLDNAILKDVAAKKW